MGPVAALTYGREEVPEKAGARLVCDTCGPPFDVGLVSGGEVHFTAESWLGGRWIGHITGIRAVDVKSIGAGGGSIVWIDPGGLLRVGPQSAGADPGPACYGHGGTEPTITDAVVHLGWLRPHRLLGGRMPLLPDRAEAALRPLANTLGQPLTAAAQAIVDVGVAHINGAVRLVSVQRGHDPRTYA